VKTTGYLAIDLFKLAVMGPMEVVVEGAKKIKQEFWGLSRHKVATAR
jgi:hypothetical protein